MDIRNRIKELRHVRASELAANPFNWRTHPKSQQDALRGILEEVGVVDALIARELPDGTLELIDGHLRADTEPDTEWPVLVLDVSEAEAKKILATFDPLAAMAETDAKQLDELLREVETGSSAVADMLTELAEGTGLLTGEGGEVELKQMDVKPPPAMTWVLIGIPTVRFGEIAETVEGLAEIPGILVESTSNDG